MLTWALPFWAHVGVLATLLVALVAVLWWYRRRPPSMWRTQKHLLLLVPIILVVGVALQGRIVLGIVQEGGGWCDTWEHTFPDGLVVYAPGYENRQPGEWGPCWEVSHP